MFRYLILFLAVTAVMCQRKKVIKTKPVQTQKPGPDVGIEDIYDRPLDTPRLVELLPKLRSGVDYPNYTLDTAPPSSFSCQTAPYPGYYADVDSRCQIFHFCPPEIEGVQQQPERYICPPLTVFNQLNLVCDWFFNINCERSPELYGVANSRLFQTALPLLDDVPEDMTAYSPGKPPKQKVTKPKKPVEPADEDEEEISSPPIKPLKPKNPGK